MSVADVCVIGGGTVGLYIAALLAHANLDTLVIEAGDARGTNKDQLVRPDKLTPAHRGQLDGWTTGVGGTSQLWGGQLWPWDEWEVQGQPDRGIRPWPLPFGDLSIHYPMVVDALGLPSFHNQIHGGMGSTHPSKYDLGPDLKLKYSTWMRRKERDFKKNVILGRSLRDVRKMTGSIVESLNVRSAKEIAVCFRGPDGDRRTVRAARVVLAAGTLGNTRILSASDLAADLPALGAGFMDHVSRRVAAMHVTDWALFRDFAAYRRCRGVLASPRIVPTSKLVSQRSILPGYGHFEISARPASFLANVQTLRQSGFSSLDSSTVCGLVSSAVREAASISESLVYAIPRRQRAIPRSSQAYLRIDVQQPVRPEVRISWGDRERAWNELDLRWVVGREEDASATVLGQTIVDSLRSLNIGAYATPLCEEAHFTDIFHMMGGTAMGASAEQGVVDTDLRVFGTNNLYVAGASVFPSGGMANPTFTALALAHRLGVLLGQ